MKTSPDEIVTTPDQWLSVLMGLVFIVTAAIIVVLFLMVLDKYKQHKLRTYGKEASEGQAKEAKKTRCKYIKRRGWW
jgi:hypothetical protein